MLVTASQGGGALIPIGSGEGVYKDPPRKWNLQKLPEWLRVAGAAVLNSEMQREGEHSCAEDQRKEGLRGFK